MVPAEDWFEPSRTHEVAEPETSTVPTVPSRRVTSTCAALWAVPSGWFGTHETVTAEPVATTSGAETLGASGAHRVATLFEVAHGP